MRAGYRIKYLRQVAIASPRLRWACTIYCAALLLIHSASAQPRANQLRLPATNRQFGPETAPLRVEDGVFPLPEESREELPPTEPALAGTRSLLTRDQPILELVEFRETPLSEAAKVLSDQSGLKIVPSAEAGKVLITLYLRNVRAGVAIDALTKAHGLFYRDDPETDIIRIYTTDEYEKDLGSFREERTEVFTLLYPNPLDVAFAIRGAFGDRVRLQLSSQLVNQQDMQDLFQRLIRFNIIDQQARSAGAVGGAGGASGFGGGGFGGGGGGFGGGLGGFSGGLGGFGGGLGGFGGGLGGFGGGLGGFGGGLGGLGGGFGNNAGGAAVAQEGEPPARLEQLTADQIQALEAGQASSIDDLLRSRKADIFVTAVQRNNQLVVRTADIQTMHRIQELVQQLDVPTPLVLLEVQVLALQLDDEFTSAFDYQFTDGKTTAGGFGTNVNDTNGFTTGNILPPAADATGPSRFDPIAPGPIGASPADNLTFQIVSSNFRFRLQMLEAKNRVTQLATPLLLTANNEVSRIFIGQTVPIVVGFNPAVIVSSVGGQTTTNVTPITELQNIGQTLLVTPNINADRTVTLRVAQENSQKIENGAQIPVSSNGVVTNQPIDTVDRRTVTGTVVAKDGLTVAIGGLITEDLHDTRQQVPVLGKIPIVGFIFRAQATGKTRTELIVMIRPYVFNTPQENAMLSRDLVQMSSLHPHAPDAVGTLNSFGRQEILTATPPTTPLQSIFRFHSLNPKIY